MKYRAMYFPTGVTGIKPKRVVSIKLDPEIVVGKNAIRQLKRRKP
jgi:hypothetical protein